MINMVNITKTRSCERCKGIIPLQKVKLYLRDKDRYWILCDTCRDFLKGDTNQNKKTSVYSKSFDAETVVTKKPSSKMIETSSAKTYRCRLNINTDSGDAKSSYYFRCPTCGKRDRVVEVKS